MAPTDAIRAFDTALDIQVLAQTTLRFLVVRLSHVVQVVAC